MKLKHHWLPLLPVNEKSFFCVFQVHYSDAFEPYVVVPSDSEPRFDERLLERMADKALYCRSLHGAG